MSFVSIVVFYVRRDYDLPRIFPISVAHSDKAALNSSEGEQEDRVMTRRRSASDIYRYMKISHKF